METIQGSASHCQLTSRFRGDGNNGTVTTTYVALFRLEQRQVQFSCGSPLPISDGDQLIVAGHPWRGMLNADAVRNVTTGLTRQSGIVSRILLALFLPVLGAFFSFVAAGFLGQYGWWVLAAFVAGSIFLLGRAAQTARAWSFVRSTVP